MPSGAFSFRDPRGERLPGHADRGEYRQAAGVVRAKRLDHLRLVLPAPAEPSRSPISEFIYPLAKAPRAQYVVDVATSEAEVRRYR